MALSTTPVVDSVDHEIHKGAAYRRSYQLLDGGVPVDLTGATGICRVNRGSTLLWSPTFTLTDAVNGRFRVDLTAAQTATQTPVIPSTAITPSSPFDFEGSDKYETLSMFIIITLGGVAYKVVRGNPKFYNSANA